jgi:surface polysaccharide O-acyltransferase-like enzyme
VATSLALVAVGSRPDLQTTVFRLLTGTWQLYFIFALLQLRLFQRLTRDRSGETRMLVLSALVTTATWALGDLLLWRTQGADAGAFEVTVERLFPCWLVFFVLGTWLRRHPGAFDAVTKRLPLLVVAILPAWALYVLELHLEEGRFGYNPRKQILLGGLLFQVLSALLALSLLRALDRSKRARSFLLGLAAAGRHTFGIYLCHTVVLIGVFALARAARVELPGSWEVPPLAAATWVLSLGLLGLVRALAPGWLLFAAFGEEKKHPAPVPTTLS